MRVRGPPMADSETDFPSPPGVQRRKCTREREGQMPEGNERNNVKEVRERERE